MILAFPGVGAQLIPPAYVVPFMLMMTAGSSIIMTLTHYATGTSPIIFGSGYVTMGLCLMEGSRLLVSVPGNGVFCQRMGRRRGGR